MILPYNFPYVAVHVHQLYEFPLRCRCCLWESSFVAFEWANWLWVSDHQRPPRGLETHWWDPCFSIWCKTESLPAVHLIFWCIRKVSEGRIDYQAMTESELMITVIWHFNWLIIPCYWLNWDRSIWYSRVDSCAIPTRWIHTCGPSSRFGQGTWLTRMEFGFDFWDDRQSAAADAIARLCVRRWDMAIVGGISNILWKMDDKWNIIYYNII